MSAHPLLTRHLVVEASKKISPSALYMDLQDERNGESGFSMGSSPIAPKFDTRMIVRKNHDDLVVAVSLNTFIKRKVGDSAGYEGSVEIVFGLENDGYGYSQHVFRENSPPFLKEFLPNPDSKSTYRITPRAKRWGFYYPKQNNKIMFATVKCLFFAVFSAKEVFGDRATVGFNIIRSDQSSGDFSSWNFLAGNGSPDANSLGRLHLKKPRGSTVEVPPFVSPKKHFRIAVTNDSPMMVVNQPYTPESLKLEMQSLRDWGVERLHWIDYSNYLSFWGMPFWKEHYRKTTKSCGDLLQAASQAARKSGLEFVPDFKIFDLSFIAREGTAKQHDALPGFDGPDVLCIPEMLHHQDAFIASNPAWRKSPQFPIRSLTLYSLQEISEDALIGIQIHESADNITYRSIRVQRRQIKIRKIQRSNRRWSPQGIVEEDGTHPCWSVEIRGLSISEPFVSIECPKTSAQLFNRHFALVEAVDNAGQEVPFICSDAIPHLGGAQKHDYSGNWPGWNNYHDPAYAYTTINLQSFGITFSEPTRINGILEPTHPEAHKIWLDRIQTYLSYDITGISIRTLCHHRRCHSWLQYAFAPSVLERFQNQFGRQPDCTEEDYAAVRRIRGEGLGEFLKKASEIIRAKGKKVIFQVETGSELPADKESRMAITYDYEKWISAGYFDELHVRSITPHSPWLRTHLLPLAKRHKVEVHLMTRNMATGFSHKDIIDIRKTTQDARQLGYDGLNFYESANLYEITPVGTFMPRALGKHCVAEAVTQSQGKLKL